MGHFCVVRYLFSQLPGLMGDSAYALKEQALSQSEQDQGQCSRRATGSWGHTRSDTGCDLAGGTGTMAFLNKRTI